MYNILFFQADWCTPCKNMKPVMESFNNVTYINIDSNKELLDQWQVRSVPTIIILKNDKEFHRFTGAVSRNAIRKVLGE